MVWLFFRIGYTQTIFPFTCYAFVSSLRWPNPHTNGPKQIFYAPIKNHNFLKQTFAVGSRKFRDWDDSEISRNKQKHKRQNESPVIDRIINVQEDPAQFFYSQKDFKKIGVSLQGIEALDSLGFKKPSKIQALSYQTLVAGQSAIIADQTGSGKTVAYLLPLIERLKLQENENTKFQAEPGKPRVLVLTPTSELASQVHMVARSISAILPVRCMCVTGSADFNQQSRFITRNSVDLLVSTPGRLNKLLSKNVISLHDIKSIVLDEVDILFLDETFDLATVGKDAPAETQFVFVTATLPVEVAQQVTAEFPGIKKVIGPGLHKVSPNLEQVIIDCSGPEEEKKNEETGFLRKKAALVQLMDSVKVQRTLIFCNTIENCRKVENVMKRTDKQNKNVIVLPHHNAIEPEKRAENLSTFMRSNSLIPMVLICTDRASRGMDFEQALVDHVILFDFPRDSSEYMRRVGRTARAGKKGRVSCLVFGRQLSLAREIMRLNKSGERLAELPPKSQNQQQMKDKA